MKAITYTQFGTPDVFKLSQVAKPTPRDDEILVRVQATTVNYGEVTARNFKNISAREFNMPGFLWLPARFAFGLNKPTHPILGSEFAGEVAAVGREVTRFKAGDQVFGYPGSSFGANAQYLCMPAVGKVGLKPANMSYAEAATLPYGALTALSLLRRVNIQPGQKLLIIGASGGIGSQAVQLAKFNFAAEVTGVCSTPRVDYVKALGADQVIDYTQEDFTRTGATYDLILDVLGRSSFDRCRKVLAPNGRYLLASFKTKQLFQMLWTSLTASQKVICAFSSDTADDLTVIKELAETGKIKTIIDRCYPLEQLAAAHRYYEAGPKRGHVVITL